MRVEVVDLSGRAVDYHVSLIAGTVALIIGLIMLYLGAYVFDAFDFDGISVMAVALGVIVVGVLRGIAKVYSECDICVDYTAVCIGVGDVAVHLEVSGIGIGIGESPGCQAGFPGCIGLGFVRFCDFLTEQFTVLRHVECKRALVVVKCVVVVVLIFNLLEIKRLCHVEIFRGFTCRVKVPLFSPWVRSFRRQQQGLLRHTHHLQRLGLK